MSEERFDVVAVKIGGKWDERFLATNETKSEAEAIMKMAVMRRGVEVEFFKVVPHGAVDG